MSVRAHHTLSQIATHCDTWSITKSITWSTTRSIMMVPSVHFYWSFTSRISSPRFWQDMSLHKEGLRSIWFCFFTFQWFSNKLYDITFPLHRICEYSRCTGLKALLTMSPFVDINNAISHGAGAAGCCGLVLSPQQCVHTETFIFRWEFRSVLDQSAPSGFCFCSCMSRKLDDGMARERRRACYSCVTTKRM